VAAAPAVAVTARSHGLCQRTTRRRVVALRATATHSDDAAAVHAQKQNGICRPHRPHAVHYAAIFYRATRYGTIQLAQRRLPGLAICNAKI